MSVFEKLNSINVNGRTEDKNGLTYLSWAWAWAEVKKRYPDAVYEVVKHNGLPYVCDPQTGYMVFTRLTIEGITHEMWLPVMDGANNAMKSEPYTIKTKYGEKYVAAATMFDINRAIMRCLTKNIGMHGLGLYIYAGEDLPEGEAVKPAPATAPEITVIKALCEKHNVNVAALCEQVRVKSLDDLTGEQAGILLQKLRKLESK